MRFLSLFLVKTQQLDKGTQCPLEVKVLLIKDIIRDKRYGFLFFCPNYGHLDPSINNFCLSLCVKLVYFIFVNIFSR